MKIRYSISLALILCANFAIGQNWEESENLSPRDLGISKYVISAEPSDDQVVILRMRKFSDSIMVDEAFEITYRPNTKVVKTVLVSDPIRSLYRSSNLNDQPIIINYGFGTSYYKDARLEQWGGDAEGLKFVLKDTSGDETSYTLTFAIRIENLKKAISLYPQIQKTAGTESNNWTYIVSPQKEQAEQGAAANP